MPSEIVLGETRVQFIHNGEIDDGVVEKFSTEAGRLYMHLKAEPENGQ